MDITIIINGEEITAISYHDAIFKLKELYYSLSDTRNSTSLEECKIKIDKLLEEHNCNIISETGYEAGVLIHEPSKQELQFDKYIGKSQL